MGVYMSKFGDIKKKKIDNFIDKTEDYQNKYNSIPQKETTERLNVEIPKSMHKSIKMRSVEEDRKIRHIVIDALNNYLSNIK
jgi:predicted HicB family RNase H-like nuclease